MERKDLATDLKLLILASLGKAFTTSESISIPKYFTYCLGSRSDFLLFIMTPRS